jgi:ADP-ribose pyrophosphatase
MTDTELVPWRVTNTRVLLDCSPWFRVLADDIVLPNGQRIRDYYRIESMDFVMIFPLANNGQILTLRGYKHGPGRIIYQLPAGYLDRANETPLVCAQRELLEETGHIAEHWRSLGNLSTSGNRGMGRAHLFLAQNLEAAAEPDSGDLETLELTWLSSDELRRLWRAGEFDNAAASATIGLALEALSRLDKR